MTGTLALISLYDIENNATRQLAAAVRARGWRVLEIYFQDWKNNRYVAPSERAWERLLALLSEESVELVGLSLRASAYEGLARDLCQRLRRAMGPPVMVGGWHATVRPERCIAFADAVCIGEADESLPEMIDLWSTQRRATLEKEPPRGFWVRSMRGGVIKAPPRSPPQRLDTLHRRDYKHKDKFLIDGASLRRGEPMAHDPLFQIMCSIGCIQRCAFCHNSFEVPGTKSTPRLRLRSVSSVIEEIQSARARNPRIRRVRFDDEIFGLSLPWFEEFASVYPREIGLPFDILSEPGVVSERYAELLDRAGMATVHLGIQSDEQANTHLLGRRASREATRAAVERLAARGIALRFLVMVDIPGVSEEQKARLYELLRGLPGPWDLYLFSLTLFPGSAWVEERLARGELSPSEVEGLATKTFQQYRVDLDYPRPPRDIYWISLMVLLSSGLLPPVLVDRLRSLPGAQQHPELLRRLASAANLTKTARVGLDMLRTGEMTPNLFARWWRWGRMITM